MEQAINAVQIGNKASMALDSADLLNLGNTAKNKSKTDKIATNAEKSSPDGLFSFSRLLNKHLAEVNDQTKSSDGNNEDAGQAAASICVQPKETIILMKMADLLDSNPVSVQQTQEAAPEVTDIQNHILALTGIIPNVDSDDTEEKNSNQTEHKISVRDTIKQNILSTAEANKQSKVMQSGEVINTNSYTNGGIADDEKISRDKSVPVNQDNTAEYFVTNSANDGISTKDEILAPNLIMQIGEHGDSDQKIIVDKNNEKYLSDKDTLVKANDNGTSRLISENNFTDSGREGFIAGQESQKNTVKIEILNENKKTKVNARIFTYGQEMSADKITAKGDDAPDIHTAEISFIDDVHVKNSKSFNETIKDSSPEENHPIKENMRFSVAESKLAAVIKDSSQQNTVFQQNVLENTETSYFTEVKTIQNIWSELNEKTKSDYRNKNIPIERNEDNISLTSLNSSTGTITKEEKVTDINPPEIINRIASEIKESAFSEGGRIKITLNPSSLGTLEMEVLVHNNKVEVVLTANNKDVQQLLNSNLDQLKSTLQNQGLTVERCDVMMSDRQDDFYRSFGNASYYQEKSGHGGQENTDEKNDEKLTPVSSVGKETRNILRLGAETDKISLFV